MLDRSLARHLFLLCILNENSREANFEKARDWPSEFSIAECIMPDILKINPVYLDGRFHTDTYDFRHIIQGQHLPIASRLKVIESKSRAGPTKVV